MNIVLFEANEIGEPLSREDERAQHIVKVLRRNIGDSFDAGVIDGAKGKGFVRAVGKHTLTFDFEAGETEPDLFPIDLIVGLSRPQTNRKILHDASSLGVRSICFVTTERGEPSYVSSKLWTTGEWRRHLVAGIAQAFSTRLPSVDFGLSLNDAIHAKTNGSSKIGLDNYEAVCELGRFDLKSGSILIAIGSERGWTGNERDLLRGNGFTLAQIGKRPLRTETAVVATVSILLSKMLK